MIFEICSIEDIEKIECEMRNIVMSQRLDLSILHSFQYLSFKLSIIKCLETDKSTIVPQSFYFSNENVWLCIFSNKPLMVWCAQKNVDINYVDLATN
jgi:hypothetical protein